MKKRVCCSKKELRKAYKKRAYYFLLTIVLFLCLLQFLGGSLFNATRYIVLNKQINKLEELNQQAEKKNQRLKAQLQIYSSFEGVEELARNNLKMVGEDEVLVLIKEQAKQ